MINIVNILIPILIIGDLCLLFVFKNRENISTLVSNSDIIIYLNILVIIYILYQYYIDYKIVKQINNFTSSIDNNITIDLSDNTNITNKSTKIIYWIVTENNGTYNNYNMNGIADIINNKVIIKLDELDLTKKYELKYRIINKTDKSEILNDTVFSYKIK